MRKEDDYLDFDEKIRTKKFKLHKRDVFVKDLHGQIIGFSETLSPIRDGSSEEVTISHVQSWGCGHIGEKPGGQCGACGKIFCFKCVERLKNYCSVCGHFTCPQDFFKNADGTGFCRLHRFPWQSNRRVPDETATRIRDERLTFSEWWKNLKEEK
jgi:hypothetical protein